MLSLVLTIVLVELDAESVAEAEAVEDFFMVVVDIVEDAEVALLESELVESALAVPVVLSLLEALSVVVLEADVIVEEAAEDETVLETEVDDAAVLLALALAAAPSNSNCGL